MRDWPLLIGSFVVACAHADDPAANASTDAHADGAPKLVKPTVALYPPASGICEVKYGPVRGIASWDADARTLITLDTLWKLDENARVSEERWYPDFNSGWAFEYDERGTQTSAWAVSDHVLYSRQVNVYGSADELAETIETDMTGVVTKTTFQYDRAGRLTDTLRRVEHADTFAEDFTHREYEGDRVRSVSAGNVIDGEQRTYGLKSFFYDELGHLARVDWDGAGFLVADGRADIRQQWFYDNEGRIVRFEQDGTTLVDTPRVNGVPDEVIEYSPECAQIAAHPVGLYRMVE